MALAFYGCARAGGGEGTGAVKNDRDIHIESEFLEALVLAGLRDDAAALDALERARERREPSSLYLRFEQRFESLAKHPRFMRLASLPGW